MFMGEFKHSLDTKGRVIIPAKFRKGLGENFIATRGLDNCIFVYPMNEWKLLEEKIRQLPLTKSDARAFSRFFLSGATECELDKQGRISLPTNLRNYADLNKQIVIIGLGSRIELWADENWNEYMDSAEESSEDIAATMEELGI